MDRQKEQLTLNDKVKFDNKNGAILGVLEGPVADFQHPTRNGRLYSEKLWDNVLKNPLVMEQFKNGGIVGELDHPADRDDICTEKVAIIMPEPPVKKNGQYYGKFNILDTPCGRIVYTLAKAGFKLGVSSRGTGDVNEYTDEVDPSTYEFTCFDVVLLPAVESARMKLVTESLDTKKVDYKKLLKEDINNAKEEEKSVMEETLDHIGIKLDEDKEQECVICHKPFEGYGNNAEPVAEGRCCDECNTKVVIPARIEEMNKAKKLDEAKEKDGAEEKAEPEENIEPEEKQVEQEDNASEDKIISPETMDDIELEEKENSEPCQIDDAKLIELLHKFLEDEGLELDGEGGGMGESTKLEEGWERFNYKDYNGDEVVTVAIIDKRFEPLFRKDQRETLKKHNVRIEGHYTNGTVVIGKVNDIIQVCDECHIMNPHKIFTEAASMSEAHLAGASEEEQHFIDLFHEIVCPECAVKEPEDGLDNIKDGTAQDEEPEVGDSESSELVAQVQDLLKENGSLKEELKTLQAEKAVSGAKVSRLNEELNNFKSVAANAGKKALEYRNLETKTSSLREAIESLKESVAESNKEVELQSAKISQLTEAKEDLLNKFNALSSENKKLKEKLQSTETNSTKQLTESSKKIAKAKKLIEQYKGLAHQNANRYIELKARGLGISKNEILNRLNESYTLDDVDSVCDDLKEYSLNISTLPFAFDKPGSAKVRIREDRSKDPLNKMDSQYDDTVDDYLLELAGLK